MPNSSSQTALPTASDRSRLLQEVRERLNQGFYDDPNHFESTLTRCLDAISQELNVGCVREAS